jgi:SAM-dependent methyltransferase
VTATGWQWDETLYAGSAAFYPLGRMPYPPEVADRLRDELCLDGRGRLLDAGCGPGSLTLLLAPLFRCVVAIDADPGMIAEAEVQARLAGVDNVTWRRMLAEDLPGRLGTFRVITFAQSFHWMDRRRVARLVRPMLTPDGACVHVHASTHQGAPGDEPLPLPRPPHADIEALVTRYLGPVRRAGRGVLPAGLPDDEDDVLRSAGFQGPIRLEVAGGTTVERTAAERRHTCSGNGWRSSIASFERSCARPRRTAASANVPGRSCCLSGGRSRPHRAVRGRAAASPWSGGPADPPAPAGRR